MGLVYKNPNETTTISTTGNYDAERNTALIIADLLRSIAQQLDLTLIHVSATINNLTRLSRYCQDRRIGQGFICMQGKEHFKYREGYQLKDTHVALAIQGSQIVGFVMWSPKFLVSKHKSLQFQHDSLSTIKQLQHTCFIMNLCSSLDSPRGTGSLLLLWAMIQSQIISGSNYNGCLLFVGKKKVRFVMEEGTIPIPIPTTTSNPTSNPTTTTTSNPTTTTLLFSSWFSSPSALGLYTKFGFQKIAAELPIYSSRRNNGTKRSKPYTDYVIKYKQHPVDREFISFVLKNYKKNQK